MKLISFIRHMIGWALLWLLAPILLILYMLWKDKRDSLNNFSQGIFND